MKNNSENMHFKFDVSTFRLLGRELITDRVTALFELVKNCYDANAENVVITFENVNPISTNSRIIIEDDGIGMSYEDIRDKWMVIGTSSKRRNKTSPSPYNRAVVGKKGVGRFAVDKLGSCLIMRTKKLGSNELQCLEVDWSRYSAEESNQLSLDFEDFNEQNHPMFTDMDNRHWIENGIETQHGTILEISQLNDIWTENDIRRAYKELSKLVRPTLDIKYPFNIKIRASQYQDYQDKKVVSSALNKATLNYHLSFRYDEITKKYFQEYLKEEKGNLVVKEKEAEIFGPIALSLYYYDKNAKRNFAKGDRIDGVKIYRDGIIATPFAEYKEDRDEQKDLFGIDKRRWSGFFEKLSTRDLLGWIDISEELNPKIIDSTNRQDFVDNREWTALKSFVIKQVHQIELLLKHQKSQQKSENHEKLKQATEDVSSIKAKIEKVKKSSALLSPDVEKDLDDITSKLDTIKLAVDSSAEDLTQMEQSQKAQENLFFSLVSLQSYAAQMSHIFRTSIGYIKRSAEFVAKWVPIGEKQDKVVKHAKIVFEDTNNLSKAMDFMLSYAEDESTFEYFDIRQAVYEIFDERYSYLFEEESIKVERIVEDDFELLYNKKAFQDMFGNLIDNSAKALRNVNDKRIKCSASREKDSLVIMFSDNGCGIPKENWDKIFDVFFTTTADFGGAGLGLYIIKSRLESIKGSISLEDNEFLPNGATFKITIPLKHE